LSCSASRTFANLNPAVAKSGIYASMSPQALLVHRWLALHITIPGTHPIGSTELAVVASRFIVGADTHGDGHMPYGASLLEPHARRTALA
jgi:hypothetical protein